MFYICSSSHWWSQAAGALRLENKIHCHGSSLGSGAEARVLDGLRDGM
jgi:hypothetical protein